MIRPFKTDKALIHFNEMLGLLTQRHQELKPGMVVEVEERRYILAICDWCGTREIIDDPATADDDLTAPNLARIWRIEALTKGLNWATNRNGDNFCSRRCRNQNSPAVIEDAGNVPVAPLNFDPPSLPFVVTEKDSADRDNND